jgi:uncharacterized membrane protein YoaK (UPF0700 family)
LAFTLGGVAGFVDGVTFLSLFGLFTANMSGNSARLGVTTGQGDWSASLTRFVPLVVWMVVVVATVVFVEARGRGQDRELRPLLTVEVVLLGVFMVVGTLWRDGGSLTPQSGPFYALAVLAAIAMGVQTSALRRVDDNVSVHTTFVSGMIVNLAEDAVSAWRHDTPGASARARMHGLVVVSFIAGAALGSVLLGELELWALAVPLVALGGVALSVRR